jgi:hypothetical protein
MVLCAIALLAARAMGGILTGSPITVALFGRPRAHPASRRPGPTGHRRGPQRRTVRRNGLPRR